MENLIIGFVGNIGVGKSTFVNAASSNPLAQILLEAIPCKDGTEKVYRFKEEVNPKIIDLFYENPAANSFLTQVDFFNARNERTEMEESAKGICLEDRTLAEDHDIFAMAQVIQGNMSSLEYEVYRRMYDGRTKGLRKPDLLVYLRAPVEVLMQRIKKRNRPEERNMPIEYISTLNCLYEEFIARQKTPVLILDAGRTEQTQDNFVKESVYKIKDRVMELDLRITTPGLSEWVLLPQAAATLRAIDAEKKT